MSKILECFNQTEDGFFVVEILLDDTKNGTLEIYREGFNEKHEYDEHITIVRQEIPFINLPIASNDKQTAYKMYLQLADYTPLRFVLMLTTEY